MFSEVLTRIDPQKNPEFVRHAEKYTVPRETRFHNALLRGLTMDLSVIPGAEEIVPETRTPLLVTLQENLSMSGVYPPGYKVRVIEPHEKNTSWHADVHLYSNWLNHHTRTLAMFGLVTQDVLVIAGIEIQLARIQKTSPDIMIFGARLDSFTPHGEYRLCELANGLYDIERRGLHAV